jgi:hypothetical protein
MVMPATTIVDRMHDARIRAFLEAAGELAGEARTANRILLGSGVEELGGSSADWPALRMLHNAATEFSNRTLSLRQRQRASAAIAFAIKRLQTNIRAGQPVRQDGFFEAEPGLRAAAEEFAEGLLNAAVADHEEAKLPHYGALMANVACHDGMDRTMAQLLARLTAELSYRQLVLLAIFSVADRLELRATDYQEERRVPSETVLTLHETADLERKCLLLQTNGHVMNMRDLVPAALTPAGIGQVLFKRLNLNHVPSATIEAVAATLR